MPSALAQLSEENPIAHLRFRTWSRQLFLSLPTWFRASALMAVLLFCYTQVANSCVQFLHCVDVGPQRLLYSAPAVDCRSACT